MQSIVRDVKNNSRNASKFVASSIISREIFDDVCGCVVCVAEANKGAAAKE